MSDTRSKMNETVSRIDARGVYNEPVDYSFRNLMKFDEIKDVLPRFKKSEDEIKKQDGKFVSESLKLGYNALADLNGFHEWCVSAFFDYKKIASLDLSFNCFDDIPSVVVELEGLHCLYLHGNKIKDIDQVDKLTKLKELRMLTLHGNSIEKLPGFHQYVIIKLPALKHLNFTAISKGDRATAQTWKKINNGQIRQADLDQTPR